MHSCPHPRPWTLELSRFAGQGFDRFVFGTGAAEHIDLLEEGGRERDDVVRLDTDAAFEVHEKGASWAEFLRAGSDRRSALGQEPFALTLNESPSSVCVTEGYVACALESIGSEDGHRISGFAFAGKGGSLEVEEVGVCHQDRPAGVALPSDEALGNGLPLLVGDADEIQAAG